ncbi:MAG: DUF6263 family protein [Isosphaeraceae bacterium]
MPAMELGELSRIGRRAAISILGLGLILTSTARADDPVGLKLRFQAGQTLRYNFQQKNSIKVKANGQDTTNASDLVIEFHWTIKSVDAEGTAEVVQTLDRVSVALTVGAKTYKLDTREPAAKDDPVAKPLSQVYRAALAAETTFKLSPRGELRDVVIASSVTEALRGSPFEASADGGSVFTPLGIKNMFAQVLPILPKAPVPVGNAWTQEIELPTGLLLVRLKGSPKLIRPGPKAEIESNLSMSLAANPGVQATIELKSQKGTGRYVLDTEAGRLVEASLNQSVELTLSLGKASLDQSSQATTTMKLVP